MQSILTRFSILGPLFVIATLLSVSIAIADITTGDSKTNVSNDVIYSEVTLVKPSSTSAGDFLLASISINGGQPATTTPPSGWTLIARTDNDTNVGLASYWKTAGASEPTSYTWTIGTQVTAVGGITRFSGVDTTNPLDVIASSTGRGTSAVAPSITTTQDNERIVTLFAVNVGKNSTLFSTSTGMTKSYDIKNEPLGPTASAQNKTQSSAGASGTTESSFDTGTREWVAQTIALRKSPPSIAFVGATHVTSNSGTVSLGSLSNGLVIAHVDVGVPNTCSAITVNGASGTLLESSAFPGQEVEMWAIPVGSMSGSVSYSATCSGGFNYIDFASYSGVNQTTPINGHTQATANATGVSSSITPSVAGTWAVVDTSKNGACATDSLTNITNRIDTASNNGMRIGDSNGTIANGVSYTQTVTSSGCSQLHLLQQALLAPAN